MADQPPQGQLTPEAALQVQQLQAALRNPMIPRLYANGFGIAQTSADVSLVLLANGVPSGIVNMSYTAAKSMVADLSKAIQNFETASGSSVYTSQELDAKMQPAMDPTKNVKL